MKSIRTRLVVSFVGTILAVFLILAFIGIYYLIMAIEAHSSQSMQLLSEEKTTELDTYFSGVERAVGVLEDYLQDNVDIKEYRSNEAYRETIYHSLEERALNSAKVVENVEAVYFRPDPVSYGGTAGFFLTVTGNGDYNSLMPTDILQYKEDDTEHVGWYYEPIKHGSPLWMEPYSNENINIYMISYVVPVYLGRDFLGVLGMDIDMTLVHQVIDSIDYLNSTGALISQSGNLLYHRDYTGGLLKEDFTGQMAEASKFYDQQYIDTGLNYRYSSGTDKYRIMVNHLENGMLLSISTPEEELFRFRMTMIVQLILIFAAALALVIFVSMRMTKKIVEPIQELTSVSTRIAKGELEQEIIYTSKDEIGTLAESIRKISVELKLYIDYIHGQAYLDAMTGVKNKAAYLEEESRQERLIKEKMASFTIYIFDINGLKKMNDTKGHEYGDMMIKDAAMTIKTVYDGNRVYRIGGDEFVVLSGTKSKEEIEREFANFDEQIRIFNSKNEKYEEDLAISKGVAVFDPETDTDFAAVFGRADEDMYRCKEEYYNTHADRRRRS
ncbi:MAG: diguanylate cyclase [Lachnospiraceae bacterium]|nr:diguanylate cyclase [Lachnospiraceae bacterium]